MTYPFSSGAGLNEDTLALWATNKNLSVLPAYLGQVATRSFAPNALGATVRSGNFSSYHFARDDLTSVAVEDGNWYAVSSGSYETLPGATPTYTRYIEYPIGDVPRKFTYNSGAQSSYTFADGETKLSDPIKVSIPRGALFRLHVHFESANGVVLYNFANQNFQTAGNNNSAVGLQIFDASSTLGGRSDVYANNSGYAVTSSSVQNAIMPTAIVAMTTQPSVLISSNSRGYGTSDYTASTVLDGCGDTGHLARVIGKHFGYINVSTSGDTLQHLLTANYYRAGQAKYCSHIIGFDMINDVNGARTIAQMTADLNSFVSLAAFAGKRKLLVTTYPNPADAATNTTPNTNDANRIGINGVVRSGQIPNASGFFDIDAVASTGLNTGLFATVNGQALQGDGLHFNYYGNQYVAHSGVIDLKKLRF